MEINIGDIYGDLKIISIGPSYKYKYHKTGRLRSLRRFKAFCKCGQERLVDKRYLIKHIDSACCVKCAFQKRPQSLNKQDPYIRLYKVLLNSSKQRKRNCTLNFEQFKELSLKNCFYCDTPPKLVKWGREPEIKYNGIDRVDNKIDYIYDNCVTCCTRCNSMKLDMSLVEFFNRIELIYNFKIKNKDLPYKANKGHNDDNKEK